MSHQDRLQSSFTFNPEENVAGAIYISQLWWYALSVLYPAQMLKRMGLFANTSVGKYPAAAPIHGEGQLYCRDYREPVYLDRGSDRAESVREFDRVAQLYDTVVTPFTRPINDEALRLIRRLVPPAARILDLGCGPGTELFRLAQWVTDGEVVGIDLAAEMVATAFTGAQQRGLHNTAFFQADVASLPQHFAGRFDAAHCSFAFHHYQDPIAALSETHRALNRTGKAFVIDGGTWWLNLIGAPFAKRFDPGWVAFHTGEEFRALFLKAGFSEFYWEELLPGIGVCVGSK